MKKVRWGIIGCGAVTEVKSGPGFQKAEGSELIAVMRRNGALAKDYALRHKVPFWYDDARQLMQNPQIDAVYIATPPHVHAEYACIVANAGKPAYIEKPLARNYAESKEIVACFKSAGLPLFVAYYRRAQEKFLKLKQLLESGSIGTVRSVQVTQFQSVRPEELQPETLPWRLQPELSGGGHFVDLASHTFDILDFLFGPIAAVQGFSSNQAGLYPAEDSVSGSWLFASGIHGSGSWCFTADSHTDRVEVVGDRGRIIFSVFSTTPIELSLAGAPGKPRLIDYAMPQHVAQPLIQTVVNELLGTPHACPSTGESALRTARVLDAIRGIPV